MKITCPAQNLKEIEPLIEAGVDEFYCGVLYGDKRLNHRPSTKKFNFSNLKEIEEAVAICHSFNKDIWLVLNRHQRLFDAFPYENKSILHNALDLFKLAEGLGFDGVIIADISLLLEITSLKFGSIEIATSTVLPTLNSESVNFFKDLGCRRTILERQMTIKEIQSIDENIENIELECFFDVGCAYVDAFCRLDKYIGIEHRSDRLITSVRPCRFPLNVNIFHPGLEPEKKSKILSSLKKRVFNIPVIFYCLSSLFYYAKLRNEVILKLAFRGYSLREKLLQLKILKSALDFLSSEKRCDYETYFNFLQEKGLLRRNFEEGYFKSEF
jgi:collagenase-like PrtC family protease